MSRTGYLGLGSNLGDRVAHLDFAVSQLQPHLANMSVSRYHDTVPVGVSGPQPLYSAAKDAAVPIEPGTQTVDATVTVVYAAAG